MFQIGVKRALWHIADTHISHKTLACRLFLFGNLLVNGHRIVEAAYNEGVETNLTRLDVALYDTRDDEPAHVSQAELQEKQGDERLIISLISKDLVIEDGHEEQHGDAQQGDEEGLGELLESRFGVDAHIGACDAIEHHPTHGKDGDGEPEAGIVEGDAETLPHIGVGHFVSLTEVVEECPGHRRDNPVDKAVYVWQDAFLFHRSW